MNNVLIYKADCFFGRALGKFLSEKGYFVFAHTTQSIKNNDEKNIYWINDLSPLEKIPLHYVVNLSGDCISSKYWTKKNKDELIDSGVFSTRDLYEWLEVNEKRPYKIATKSNVGFYGVNTYNNWNSVCHEESQPQPFFISEIYQEWEYEALHFNQNTSILRFAHIFDQNNGFLSKLLSPILKERFSHIGDGFNPINWIHINDACRATEFILISETKTNIYNIVAPQQLPQKKFCDIACHYFKKNPKLNRVNPWLFRILLGEKSDIYLNGMFSIPLNLEKEGFKFEYKTFNKALDDLYQIKKKPDNVFKTFY